MPSRFRFFLALFKAQIAIMPILQKKQEFRE
jgi:hypothetical protein